MIDQSREARLKAVYDARSRDGLRAGYDAWAKAYDADVQAFGYLSPAVAFGLAARHMPPATAPILDAGAGTGIMGELLSLLGYRGLDALDLSEGMLEIARSKGVYRDLHQAALGDTLALPSDHYAGIVCVGVFTVGHAEPEALDELLRIAKPGAVMVFTVTLPVYESGFRDKLDAFAREGVWRRIEMTPAFDPLPREDGAPLAHGFAYRVSD